VSQISLPLEVMGNLKETVSGYTILKSPEKIFLFIALFFGIIFLFLTPPFQAADEPWHFYKSYEISEFKNFGILQNGVNGDYLPESLSFSVQELMDAIHFHPEKKFDLEKSVLFIQYPLNQDQKIFTNGIMGFYAPFSYMPQAMGILVGKIFNFSPLVLMYLGRICNFSVWLLLIFTAIRLTPVAKWVFLFLALSPMSLFQAASLSQDAFINGIAFLAIALIFYYAFSNEKTIITNNDVLILLGVLVILAFSKEVYSCIALLFLVIPLNKFPNKKDFIVKACCVILPVIFIDILWSLLVKGILNYVVTGWGFDINNQFMFILYHPVDYFQIFLHTLSTNATFYLYTFIGGLGWLDTFLPESVYYLFAGSLIFLGMFDSVEGIVVSLKQKIILATVVFLTTLGIFTSEYLIWNHVGVPLIEGPSGRYFIPISPLILLLFYNSKKLINNEIMNFFKLILTGVLIFVLFATTQVLHTRYYSEPIPLSILLGLLIIILIAQWCLLGSIEFVRRSKRRETLTRNTSLPDKKPTFIYYLLFLCLSITLIILIGTGNILGTSQTVVNESVGEIYGGNIAGQTFYSPLPNMNSIDVNLATYARINTKAIIFHLRDSPDSKTDIESITVNARQIRDNIFYKFKFPPVKDSMNRSYYFFIESPDSVPGDAITIWSSKEDTYPAGTAYLNSIPVARDLSFNVYYAPSFFL
jgi:uncharacterized membrane protein